MNSIHYNQVNEFLNCKKSVTKPEIGMCGTLFVGSDRYAIVVVDVISLKKIRIQHMYEDSVDIITDKNNVQWLSENQLKKYNKNEGNIYTYRKNYRWMQQGANMWGTGAIYIGYADNYLDPSF